MKQPKCVTKATLYMTMYCSIASILFGVTRKTKSRIEKLDGFIHESLYLGCYMCLCKCFVIYSITCALLMLVKHCLMDSFSSIVSGDSCDMAVCWVPPCSIVRWTIRAVKQNTIHRIHHSIVKLGGCQFINYLILFLYVRQYFLLECKQSCS